MYTGYWIRDDRIYGPSGYRQCWIRDGHIYGPKEKLPWT